MSSGWFNAAKPVFHVSSPGKSHTHSLINLANQTYFPLVRMRTRTLDHHGNWELERERSQRNSRLARVSDVYNLRNRINSAVAGLAYAYVERAQDVLTEHLCVVF